MSLLFFFFLGLILGSFANVYFLRVPENLSLVTPGSFCLFCRKTIPWFDNLPVVSYLLLRRKCRFCGSRISIQYPLVELGLALLFFAVSLRFQHQPPYVLGALLFFVFIVFLIGGIDLVTYFKLEKKYGIIPDHLTYPLLIAGIGFSAFNPIFEDNWSGLLSGAETAAVLIVFRWLAGKILKQEALGLGDVKMLAGVSTWLGWKGLVLTLLVGSVLGSSVSLVLIFMKKLSRKSSVPFGPFLSAGALSALFFI